MAKRAPLEDRGEIPCRLLCPEYSGKDLVRFTSISVTRKRQARSMMLLLGEGALFVVPPLRSLKELVRTYREILKTVRPEAQAARAKARDLAAQIASSDYALVLQPNDKWRIRFKCKDGGIESAEAPNSKGMRYLVALVEHSRVEVIPTDLKRGYGDKAELMVWYPAKKYETEIADGESEGVDMRSAHAMPDYHLVSGGSRSRIKMLKEARLVVLGEINKLDDSGTPISDTKMEALIAKRKQLDAFIKQLERRREINPDVKSVGKALSRMLTWLNKHNCVDLSAHLSDTIRPLESATLSYMRPPDMQWFISWGTATTRVDKGRKTRNVR